VFETVRPDAPPTLVVTDADLIPRYDVTLQAGPGMHGLTLYVHAPQDYTPTVFRWLIDEIRALGPEVPPALLAHVPQTLLRCGQRLDATHPGVVPFTHVMGSTMRIQERV
jgi:hypothetical protein